jgi:replicative DNA helicase
MTDSFPELSNLPAERAALGAFIEESSILTAAIDDGLTPDDFSLSDHQRMFRALVELRDKRFPVDYISLAEHLGNSQYDFALLGELISGVVIQHSHIAHHVRVIRQKSRLRALLRLSDWIAQAAVEVGADPEEIGNLVLDKLESVRVTA